MRSIFSRVLKFISSRLLYLMIGIFLAIGATYVYASWNDAKTGGSAQLGQSNWNALVTEVHNKCGTNCDSTATGATASGNSLTESNWNNLADLLTNTLTNCATDNSGKCFVNETLKSALDADLTASNIKSGVDVFGVSGSYSGATCPTCSSTIKCRCGRSSFCWTNYCDMASTNCQVSCETSGGTYGYVLRTGNYDVIGNIMMCDPYANNSAQPGYVQCILQ